MAALGVCLFYQVADIRQEAGEVLVLTGRFWNDGQRPITRPLSYRKMKEPPMEMNNVNEALALRMSTEIEQCFKDKHECLTIELIGNDNPLYSLTTFTDLDELKTHLNLSVGLFGGCIEDMSLWSSVKVFDNAHSQVVVYELVEDTEFPLQ
ncbi:TPA: hypothetical protein ACMDR7_004287 [Vibrio parahaemolyticus]